MLIFFTGSPYFCKQIMPLVVSVLLMVGMGKAPLHAQGTGGSLLGTVLLDNTPVEGATIQLLETPMGAISQQAGLFEIHDIPEGAYQVKVTYQDWELLHPNQLIHPNDTLTIQLALASHLYRMNPVVVSANRVEISRTESPVIVTVSDEHIFSATQSLSLSEGLSFQPGLRLETNCQNCGFTSLRMNGLGGAYTQILIDSRPIFSALNGVYGLDQIPVSMIDRIEVVRGGGSASVWGQCDRGYSQRDYQRSH